MAGNGGNDGSSDRRFQTRIALIGVAGAVLAAVIGAVITLHPWSSGPPKPSGGLQISISTVKYPVLLGKRVIEVVGTVQNQAVGEEVFAFAGNNAGVPPFYPGGPAAVSSGGIWTAEITNYQGSPGNLSVWAGVVTLPPSCSGSLCVPAADVNLSKELESAGPRTPALKKVTPAFRTTFPSG